MQDVLVISGAAVGLVLCSDADWHL